MAHFDENGDPTAAQVLRMRDYVRSTPTPREPRGEAALILSYAEAVQRRRSQLSAAPQGSQASSALRDKVKRSLEKSYAVPGMVDFITRYLLSIAQDEPSQARRLGIDQAAQPQ